MATVNLTKGGRVELAKGISALTVDLTWKPSSSAKAWDLDIMALELNEDGILIDANTNAQHFVFYGNLADPEKAVVHSGDDRTGEGDGEEMKVNLQKVHPSVKEIVFLLNIFESQKLGLNFGQIKDIKLRIFQDGSSTPALVYDLEDEASHNTASVLKIFSIYRSGGIWKVKAINEGVTSTLSGVLKTYGLDSTDNSI